MNAKEPTANCVNHPLAKANYNSIFAGGQPLCFSCALTESEDGNGLIYSKTNG